MVKLKLVNVSKKIRKEQVLRGITLETGDKELFVVTGPPGAGKTTLLKIIAGLVPLDEGEVYIGDELVNYKLPAEREIGMVFETPAVYPNRTAFENIAFPLKVKGLGETEIKKRVYEVADFLQVTHLLDRKPHTYSGGELQRVALARVLVRSPRILLLDEPLKNLDAKIRERMRVELKRLQREFGITMIFTTHDQLEAVAIGDRIAVMNKGVIEQVDAPEKTYNSPKTVFVGRFIGSPSMNLVDCALRETEGRWVLDATEFSIDVTHLKDQILANSTGPELILGARPPDISVEEEPVSKQSIEATLELTEALGSEKIAELRVGRVILTALVPSTSDLSIGEKAYIELKKEKLYLFDKKTENLIICGLI